MSWSDLARFARMFAALALAGLTAACFQPLYAEHPTPVGARPDWPIERSRVSPDGLGGQ